ncbi:DNA translocase FtsK [Agrobacterium rubi]|uniref:DNA translocase FtsK n=1 Tax=Agrobacterium rubi TaxID=28099 RepID=A0AAE7R751_9HYPH|nr:DNA translocase FtsK [Agrobacterium rubi]NTF03504.1 DNA translocase FtsK [Agrobacterium rubi]NTF37664.1 DNA translocase FtsK [Agrobacterium rubi]OCJ45791.1 cell division protein FtsK [Agrobacterium rubi]QTG00172.1 DNA translocase FtsK [Agrobacterium rubi]
MTSPTFDGRDNRFVLTAFVVRQIMALCGFAVLGALTLGITALATWNVSDPSLSYATGNEPANLLGRSGAIFADIMMQFLGLSALIAMLPILAWAFALISGRRFNRVPARLVAWVSGAFIASASLGCFPAPLTWPLPNGIGGVIGDMILRFPALFIGAYPTGTFATVLGVIFALPAAWLMLFASGLLGAPDDAEEVFVPQASATSKARKVEELDEEEDDGDGFFGSLLAFGAVAHYWYITQARFRRLFGLKPKSMRNEFEQPYDFNDYEFGTLNEPSRLKTAINRLERADPSFEERAEARARREVSPPSISMDDDADGDEDDSLPDGVLSGDSTFSARPPVGQTRITPPSARPKPSERVARDAQPSFIARDGFQLPSVHLLAEPKSVVRDNTLSAEVLEQNARRLEGVLEDFGVKGEIIHVRPGPVVTMYELEPAPGIKSSRVIGLADDIARSMSAIAARVAVVPGRNAIGIELPNKIRETVYLRELIASRDFENNKAKLPMSLGKTIGGEAVIADLAKMPHLLVAGTTGSGKSVAINTMILSLLYRMTPEQCRLIMIDPKMLELSVYDGIPHLLSPVVTDPKKAVVALKWTVREMEERYKKMSKIGVRNIDGFNTRVQQALDKGEVLTRTVQTGFDRQTGEAMYETEEFDLKPLPYIVVIIDEMADLMMVAGKDIEGAVQRLAQMARAAGIHVIMATQRPSVDVITGTIKANFPTRISFQVTSKIDSRTILGEQGAEQLLGMGDMLYMAGGGRIQRVHGPFVADNEVEDIVAYLKTQGSPEYLESITEEDEDEDGGGPAGTSNMADSEDPYDQAVAVVLRDGKASTSYVQRRLGIGYNRAASLIERMEQEGIIGPANHAGKREILVPTEQD